MYRKTYRQAVLRERILDLKPELVRIEPQAFLAPAQEEADGRAAAPKHGENAVSCKAMHSAIALLTVRENGRAVLQYAYVREQNWRASAPIALITLPDILRTAHVCQRTQFRAAAGNVRSKAITAYADELRLHIRAALAGR